MATDGGVSNIISGKGPRKTVTLRLPAEVYAAAKVAAVAAGSSPHAVLTVVVEDWANDFLEENAAGIRAVIKDRRARS